MRRFAHQLPPVAREATSEILRRARSIVTQLGAEKWGVSRKIAAAQHEDDLACRRYGDEHESLLRRLQIKDSANPIPDFSEVMHERCGTLQQAYESAREARRAEIEALKAKEAGFGEQIAKASVVVTALREAQSSAEGLAPWDTAALEALRGWSEGAEAADAPLAPLLKGSEAASLVQSRLGVSRSVYYERFRGLLRGYHVLPPQVKWYTDGSAVAMGPATLRFRRDEVEAMLAFIGDETR